MPQRDPFSGVELSKLVEPSAGKLDQRLFGSIPKLAQSKPTTAPVNEPRTPTSDGPAAATTERRPPASGQAGKVQDRAPSLRAARFHLGDDAFFNATYRFSEDELNALEDMRLEIRRDSDVKVSKNDLVRSSLHMLLEDYIKNREESYASRKVRKR